MPVFLYIHNLNRSQNLWLSRGLVTTSSLQLGVYLTRRSAAGSEPPMWEATRESETGQLLPIRNVTDYGSMTFHGWSQSLLAKAVWPSRRPQGPPTTCAHLTLPLLGGRNAVAETLNFLSGRLKRQMMDDCLPEEVQRRRSRLTSWEVIVWRSNSRWVRVWWIWPEDDQGARGIVDTIFLRWGKIFVLKGFFVKSFYFKITHLNFE